MQVMKMTSEESFASRLFTLLTQLAHPSMMSKLPPELYIEVVSLRLMMSPTATSEIMTIEKKEKQA
jgi:hypothetical protein